MKSHVLPETQHLDTGVSDADFRVAALIPFTLQRIYSRTRVQFQSPYKLTERDTLYKLR
jgi:hypothetical protein